MNRSELIFRVLSNQATSQEVKELDAWVNQSKDNREEYEDIKLLWDNSQENEDNDKDDSFYDGLNGIKQTIQGRKRQRQARVILLIFALIFVLYLALSNVPWSREPISLQLVDVPLSDLPIIFRERYKVDVTVPDNLLACQFSGILYHESAVDALRIIAESLDLTYLKIDKDSFVMVGNGCFEKNKN